MEKNLVMHQDGLIEFFDLLSMEKLKKADQYEEDKNNILRMGKLALIGFQFLTTCFLDLRSELPEVLEHKFGEILVKEFIVFQIEWKLFSAENIQVLHSGIVLSKCMQSLSYVSDEEKLDFRDSLGQEDMANLIFWIEYINEQGLKTKLINRLICAKKGQLLHNVCFLPTMQQIIEKLLEIGFNLRNECQEGDLEDQEEQKQILECAEYTLMEFEKLVSKKPVKIYDDYKDWIESIQYQIILLKNQRDKILSSDSEFYRGLVWLTSDKLEDIQEAKNLFNEKKNEQEYSWWTNYIIAYVMEIVKKHDLDLDYEENLICYEKEFKLFISQESNIGIKQAMMVYAYTLYLYLSLNIMKKFWYVYGAIPAENKIEPQIAVYVIEAYIAAGESEEAKDLFNEVKSIYGLSPRLNRIQKRITESESNITSNTEEILKPDTKYGITNERDHSEQLRNMINELPHLSNHLLAEILIDEQEFQLLPELGKNKTEDKHKMLIISMVFHALKDLEEYSVNLLHKEKPSTEDVYNRTVKLLFNLRERPFLGYSMEEQTKGGRTNTIYTSGEQGVGRRDLIIKRKERTIALLEGVRLSGIDSKVIQNHIEKLRMYNIEQVSLIIIPIYGHMKNKGEFWKKYGELLKRFKKDGVGCITKVEENVKFEETDYLANFRFVSRTTHDYEEENLSVEMYHVLINVGEA